MPDALHLAIRVGVDLDEIGDLHARTGIERNESWPDESLSEPLDDPRPSLESVDAVQEWESNPHRWLVVALRGAAHAPRPACQAAAMVWDRVSGQVDSLRELALDGTMSLLADERLALVVVPPALDPAACVRELAARLSALSERVEQADWRAKLVVPPIELGVPWPSICRELMRHARGTMVLARLR